MSISKQGLHWLDKVAKDILAWQQTNKVSKLHVDDMKTPSGRIHTGSLRGVLLHDLVAKELEKQGQKIVSTYVFNDMDPMDGLPSYLDQTAYALHMGEPLYRIPKPPLEQCGIDLSCINQQELEEFKNAKNFAEIYALDFIHAIRKLGCSQKIVWSHQLYQSGKMDKAIAQSLNSVDKLRSIYQQVADYKLPELWYPFQVICPQCGKLGSTLTTAWDGKMVEFHCLENKVEWAKGCGFKGTVTPFGGTGKLLWKVDWPAHWQIMGINIEGAGKDHTSAGGSRDMANAICKQVFDISPPFDMPYEWILLRGSKMSSSKGVGTSAREFTELFPPEIGRFLFANRNFNQVIDFDPSAAAIPDLYDEYDLASQIYHKEIDGDQRLAKAFAVSQLKTSPKAAFLPRFRDVAVWMQHPEIDLDQKFTTVKGQNLTKTEKLILEERKKYAQIWLDRYAPQEFQFKPLLDVPKAALDLSDLQKIFLKEAITLVDAETDWRAEILQQKLYELAKKTVGTKEGFKAIYLAFLGKTHGPKAAWLLLDIDKSFRNKRINQLLDKNQITQSALLPNLNDENIFSISSTAKMRYPSMYIGIAIIKGVKIQEQTPALEKEKQALVSSLQGLTTAQIGTFAEVLSYRRLYKEMGVDWHSRRPSPEALLRRLAQGKELYTINTVVDSYNLVVMSQRVSVGAFDLDNIRFATSLKVARGGEKIQLLGKDQPVELAVGEVAYFDQLGPYNLDFNYRDALRTAVTTKTTNILINVDGIYDIDRAKVEKALLQTVSNIQKHCGGKLETIGVVAAKE